MRILEVITPSKIGGAETYLAATIQQLQTLHDEVFVFCPSGRPIVSYLEARQIHPITWKTHGKLDPRTVWGLVALIKKHRIDVVHTHLTSASFLGALAARLAHVPSVATVHGMCDAFWYRFPQQLIAVSDAVKAHLVAREINPEKISVVYNGVLLRHYHPITPREARMTCDIDPATPYVGVFGRLSTEKGQDILLKAWPTVLEQCPQARLMLVGDGKQRAALQQLAATLGIADTVEFNGFVTDPRQLMSACNLVVAPSRREGLGLSVLESMALQRPVVAADTGGLVEVVQHEKTGFLVPPNDAPALAQRIGQLLLSPALASQFGECGRERVVLHFDLSRQIRQLRTILHRRERASYQLTASETRLS